MANRTAPFVKLTLILSPNPNIAGPARVRQRLDARHGLTAAERAIIWQKTCSSPLVYQCFRVGATVAVLLAWRSLSA